MGLPSLLSAGITEVLEHLGFSVGAGDQIQLLTPVCQMLFQLNHLPSTPFSLLALYFWHIPKPARYCGVI